jgi:periplasmic protein TonB
MSYVDSDRSKLQPGGLIAAALVNGAALLGVLLAAPEVYEQIKDSPLIADFNRPPEIPPPPPAQAERQKDKKDVKIIIPPITTDHTRIDSGTKLTVTTKTGTGNDLTSGGGTEITQTPPSDPDPIEPQAHNPTLKSPRIDPRYAALLQPEYPPSMIRAEIEGSVAVRVLVGIDGRVKDVQVIRAENEAFAEATKRQALKRWRFLAGTSDGQAIESWRDMTVRFEIPE